MYSNGQIFRQKTRFEKDQEYSLLELSDRVIEPLLHLTKVDPLKDHLSERGHHLPLHARCQNRHGLALQLADQRQLGWSEAQS